MEKAMEQENSLKPPYRFLPGSIQSFHLEITSKCAMACPRCPRTIYKGQYPVEDLSLELIKKRFTAELLDPVQYLVLCGDHGDPIYHSRFHDVIGHFKKHGKKLTINTNGSRRSREWWEKTTDILESRDHVKFSIDGLEDTNHKYRVNSHWPDIMNAVEACRGKTRMIWKFIVFKHNQHQIHRAEKLAEKLGFEQFIIVRSHLFGPGWIEEGQSEDLLMPDPEWLDPKYFGDLQNKKKLHWLDHVYHGAKSTTLYKKWKEHFPGGESGLRNQVAKIKSGHEEARMKQLRVFPKCKFGIVHYVTASGHYLPCCWAGNYDLFKDSVLEKNSNYFDLKKFSFDEILESQGLKNLEKTWKNTSEAPRVCQLHCTSREAPKDWSESYDVNSRYI